MAAILRKILYLLLVLFLGLVACNKDAVNEKGEEKEGKPVKEENVVNVEEAEQYDAEIANRKFQIPELVSNQINKSIEVQDVKLEEQSKNDDGTIDYLYTTKFKVYDENSSEIYEKEGELTISTTNNEMKIDRDWSRGVKIDGLDGGL